MKVFICLSLIMIGFWTESFAKEAVKEYTVIENKAKLPILNPTLSQRNTLKIRLENGLEAVIISDPSTPQSGAALTVQVGSWEDPAEYPGLAHFLEHMLFLGTKKFPKEGDYQGYISEHGGSANAFTTNDSTSFLFVVNNEAMPGALDRFSEFFKEPSFNPSGVSREMRAIDQEFNKNIENDDIRQLFVLKENNNPQHPNFRFTAGNSTTLGKVSKETFTKWYNEHYSANLMHLIVYSNLPIEKIRDLVVENFKGVKDLDKKPLELSPGLSAHSNAVQGKLIYVQSVKNIRDLTLVWDLPAKFTAMTETLPANLVCYVLGHEGKNSLLAELKREKLAEGIQCGSSKIGPDTTQFYVDVKLTDEGLKKLDVVIERIFQAILALRQKEIPKYLFDEMKRLAEIQYQYQSRPELFSQLEKEATDILDEELETYPEKTLIVQKFDPKAVNELLNYLSPENAVFMVTAPTNLTGVKPDKQEKWMGISYAMKPIDAEVFNKWKSISEVHPDIGLPAENAFVPKHLDLVNKDLPVDESLVPHPKTLIDDKTARIYYAPDTYFHSPQIYAWFEIKTPEVEMGKAAKVVLGDLYVKSVNEAISKFSYDADMAGLKYTVDRTDNGIGITLLGYSENAHLLFAEILKRLKEIHPSDDKFDLYKQSLLRQYQNTYKDSPLVQAAELVKNLIYKNFTIDRQKSAAIRKVTFEKFNEFLTHVFNYTYVEGVIYGNVTEEQAKDLSEQLLKTLGGVPYPKNDQLKKMVVVLPEKKGPYYFEAKTKSKGNAVILAIEAQKFSLKEKAALQLLMQAIDEPFFENLRTKQQTGYSIGSSAEDIEKHLFSYFVLLSNTHDVRDLLARFELFIEGFLQEMDKTGFNENDFNLNKNSLLGLLQQHAISVEDMGKLLKTLAFKYDGDFDWITKRIQSFQELTYPEFIKISHEILGRANKRRFAVLLKGVINEENVFEYIHLHDILQLKKESVYTPR